MDPLKTDELVVGIRYVYETADATHVGIYLGLTARQRLRLLIEGTNRTYTLALADIQSITLSFHSS